MWRSHAEYVWRVVYYWVQCCIVRVTCGAHSVHSAASTCVYKEREHLVYIAERLDRKGESVLCKRAERICMFCYIAGQSLYFYICNKWPTRG